jgi:hypothetical protein
LSLLQCILAIYLVGYPYAHDKRFLKKVVAAYQVLSNKHLLENDLRAHTHTHNVLTKHTNTEKKRDWDKGSIIVSFQSRITAIE